MKRLTAVALALVLLLTTAACAERAKVLTWSNPYLELTQDGERRDTDLFGFSVRVMGGRPDDVSTLQAELLNQGEVVERGVLQCIDQKLYIEADALSDTYAVDLSELGGRGQALVDAIFEDIDHLLDFKLPVFGGVSLQMVDMTAIAPLTGAPVTTDASGKKSAKIDVPYFLVKQALAMAGRYRTSLPESAQTAAGPLFSVIDGMVESDSGFALKGRVSTKKKKSSLSLDVYPVQGGVTAEAPEAKVKIVSAKNRVDVTVDLYRGESTVNVATFNLTSHPKSEAMDFSLDVMSLVQIDGRLYKEDGTQAASLNVNAMGQKTSAYLNYGTIGYTDFVNVMVNASNRLDLTGSIQANDDGAGNSAGTSALDFQTYGDDPVRVGLTGEVAEGYEDVAFGKVEKTGNAVDLLHLTDGQSQKLTDELNRLLDRFVSRSRIGTH